MSVDKLVDSTQLDSDLTSVANVIRTKGNTASLLAFPVDFRTAINALQIYNEYSGTTVSFNTASSVNIKKLLIDMTPVQSGSGDPAMDNVRPITGYSTINIYKETVYDPTATPSVTITIPADPGTVYYGTLDVITGLLLLTWEMRDLGTLTWSSAGSNGSSSASISAFADAYGGSTTAQPHVMCDVAKVVPTATYNASVGLPGYFMQVNPSNTIYIMSPTFANMSYTNIRNTLSGHQVLIRLKNPLAYQLAPQTVQTLTGNNVIWSDSGSVTIEYIN